MAITLKTLPQATAQEVFNQVATHLLTQNMKCGINNTRGFECKYRGKAGAKCAAGCLIGDDEYDCNEMEGVVWNELIQRGIVPESHRNLISDLQSVHDLCAVDVWGIELRTIARELDLRTDAINRHV